MAHLPGLHLDHVTSLLQEADGLVLGRAPDNWPVGQPHFPEDVADRLARLRGEPQPHPRSRWRQRYCLTGARRESDLAARLGIERTEATLDFVLPRHQHDARILAVGPDCLPIAPIERHDPPLHFV